MKKIIYFYGPSCGMCRVLKPRFEEVINRLHLKEGTDYEYIDASECEDLVAKYGVRNVPTLVFLSDGEIIGKSCGVEAYKDIEKYM